MLPYNLTLISFSACFIDLYWWTEHWTAQTYFSKVRFSLHLQLLTGMQTIFSPMLRPWPQFSDLNLLLPIPPLIYYQTYPLKFAFLLPFTLFLLLHTWYIQTFSLSILSTLSTLIWAISMTLVVCNNEWMFRRKDSDRGDLILRLLEEKIFLSVE